MFNTNKSGVHNSWPVDSINLSKNMQNKSNYNVKIFVENRK